MKREIKIGLVVFLGLALLGGLVFLSGGRLIRERGNVLYVLLPEARGLPPGAPIYISGVESGYVKDVLLTKEGVKILAFIKDGLIFPSIASLLYKEGGFWERHPFR